ncbi:hypothetical protein CHUAL_010492 [Chamberlinius hualienensis]
MSQQWMISFTTQPVDCVKIFLNISSPIKDSQTFINKINTYQERFERGEDDEGDHLVGDIHHLNEFVTLRKTLKK